MNKDTVIDLYELEILRLVADARGFSAAAERAGISQSALSRKVQAIEMKLGVNVLERTTRKVSLTQAGAILLRETVAIPNILSGALRRVREECLELPRQIRIGISSELGLAHVPGIFSRQKTELGVRTVVSQAGERELFEQVGANFLDVAVVCEVGKSMERVEVAHEMCDQYCVITGSGDESVPEVSFKKWASGQSWLLPPDSTTSRALIDNWLGKQRVEVTPRMELESFDLMIQFVALGMGSAFVPSRALSGFARKHQIRKVSMPSRLSRKLVAVTPRFSRVPEHVRDFVSGILFS